MTTAEPIAVDEEPPEPPKSLFAATRDGITFTEHIAATDMREGMALLILAREVRDAGRAMEAAQARADAASADVGRLGGIWHRARAAYMEALEEVSRLH